MTTIHIRKIGTIERAGHAALVWSLAAFIVLLGAMAARLYPLAALALRDYDAVAVASRKAVGGFANTGSKMNIALDRASSAAGDLQAAAKDLRNQARVIGEEIARPCSAAAGPDACGLLAQAKKTIVKAGDAVVTAQLAIQRSQGLASASLTDASRDLDRMAASGSATFEDIDAILKRPDVSGANGMIANGNRILASGAGIADTTNRVFSKEARPLLDPPHGAKAALKKMEPLGWIGLKATACVFAGAC